jgi:thiamine transport system ATP-binding protein
VSAGLAVDGVAVTLGGQPVLGGVDLRVGPTESVALLGPSGIGKSTLLRVIAGLVRPDAGAVSWDGADLADVPAHRRAIGLVFQDAVLFPHRDVAGNVAYGLEAAGVPSAERRAEVTRLLGLVDLAGYEGRDVHTLSGGQAQRVALARALAPRPRLLLLDEPFGALDRDLRERLGAEVRDLLRAQGIPAVHVTHDEQEATLVADRVVTLVAGPGGATVDPLD